MKIYRVHIRAEEGRSVEYRYFANKREARAYWKENTPKEWDDRDFGTIEVEMSKPGILNAFNTWGSHPDNG